MNSPDLDHLNSPDLAHLNSSDLAQLILHLEKPYQSFLFAADIAFKCIARTRIEHSGSSAPNAYISSI